MVGGSEDRDGGVVTERVWRDYFVPAWKKSREFCALYSCCMVLMVLE